MSAKNKCPRVKALLVRAGVLAFYLALWAALAARIDQPLLLPTPVSVLQRLAALIPDPLFIQSLGATLLRTLLAYGLGIACAVLLGILCVKCRMIELLLSPLLSAIRATPVTSFIVLALVWLSSPAIRRSSVV